MATTPFKETLDAGAAARVGNSEPPFYRRIRATGRYFFVLYREIGAIVGILA